MVLTTEQRQAVEKGAKVPVTIDGIECFVMRANAPPRVDPQVEARDDGMEIRRTVRSIEDELAEIAAELTDDDWAELPDDLTDHLDHYLYGTPKK